MKEYFLEELLQIKNGRDHKHLSEGNIPVFGSGGIMRYGNQAIYNDESILLPRKGSLTNIQFVNKPFWTVDTIYYTVINKEKANPLYLYHYLKQLDLSYLNSGTGVPSMTFGAYYQVKVNLPSLDIQQKIAKVLSDLEAKIEVNNRINNELEAIAKTLYDYWFVQFDFPDSNGKPYKNSGGKMVWNEELKREIPENWKVKIVDDLLAKELTTTKIPSSEILEEGLIPVVDQSTNYIKGFTNDKTALIKAEKARIVFGDHTRILKLINFDFARGADGTQVLLSNNEKMPQYLFYHCLLKIDLSNYGYARHFKFLKDSTIIVPSKKIAIQFEKLVSSFYGKIKANIFQNQELASLRDWLLPMLMNEQVKITDAEEMVNEQLGMVAESSVKYKKSETINKQIDNYNKIQILYTTIWANNSIGAKQGEMATAKDVYLLDRIYGLNTGFKFAQHNWGSFDPKEKQLFNTKQYFHKPNFPNSKAFYLDVKDDGKLLDKIPSDIKKIIKTGIVEMNEKVFRTFFGSKKAEAKELYATIIKCIEDRQSIDLAIVREEMQNWKIKQDGKELTKAIKFSISETKEALKVIIENKWCRNVLNGTEI